jgi:cell wall-associated NlpC family hydrolase
LLGCRTCACGVKARTYLAPQTMPESSSLIRRFQAFVVASLGALFLVVGAAADPGSVSSKEAQAQQVLGQINQIDQSLNAAVEAYNLANVRLHKIRGDLRDNKIELNVATASLKRSQKALAQRLVSTYTTSEENSTLAVLLGSTSLDDLVTHIETINATSKQDTHIVNQVTQARASIQRARTQLQRAQSQQQTVVAQKAAERQRIGSQLAQRRALLSSIRGEIAHIKAAEAARQLQLVQEARARLVSAPASTAPQPVVGVSASTPEGSTVAPPNVHGGVVGIAMRYLGVPYVWGGSSPRGFDCSGLVMYVFAQIGVSLPHSSYAQYGMGTPVSMSELQPGDLVFFAGASHVGIYIGGGQFIHAPHTGDVVKISSLTGWYASEFAGGRRI